MPPELAVTPREIQRILEPQPLGDGFHRLAALAEVESRRPHAQFREMLGRALAGELAERPAEVPGAQVGPLVQAGEHAGLGEVGFHPQHRRPHAVRAVADRAGLAWVSSRASTAFISPSASIFDVVATMRRIAADSTATSTHASMGVASMFSGGSESK